MDVARRRRLVAQPGGLTMSFVLRLVDITTDNVLIIDVKDWRQHQQFIKANNQSINQSIMLFRVVQVTKSLQDPLEVGNSLLGISDNVREW